MPRSWFGACCAAGVLCALALAVPPRARACSQAAGFVRIVSRSADGPASVPVGAGVLIEFVCQICADDFESTPPEVMVTDEDGLPVAGSARWVDTPYAPQAAHALWEPDVPLAEGNYTLTWMTPISDGSAPLPFVVGGDASDMPSVSFEAALDSRSANVGASYECLSGGACYAEVVATQSELLPVVIVHTADDPSLADVAQFLFRVRPEGGVAGPWYSFGDSNRVGLSADFAAVAKRYCVTVEAMRVSDATVTTVGKPCVDDTLGEVGAVPQAYATCVFAQNETERAAIQEKYRKAWCSDNADACTQHGDAYPDACGDYAEVCNLGAARADGGSPEAPRDGGTPTKTTATDGGDSPSSNQPNAGTDTGGAPGSHMSGADGGAQHTSAPGSNAGADVQSAKSGGGCAVSPGSRSAPASIALLACVAAWLARRRRNSAA